MILPLGVFSGMHSKSAKSWILGLWSRVREGFVRRSGQTQTSAEHFSHFFAHSRSFAAKKENIE